MSRKVYTNFNIASLKANKATYMDNISTQSEGETHTPKKKLTKRPSRYEDSSDHDDDTDDSDISEVPAPPKTNRERIDKNKNKSGTFTEINRPSNGNKIFCSSNSEIPSTCSTDSNSLQHSSEGECIDKNKNKSGTFTEINRRSNGNKIFCSSNNEIPSTCSTDLNSLQHSSEGEPVDKNKNRLNTLTEINTRSDGKRILCSSNSVVSSGSSTISTNSVQHSEEYKYILKQLHILNGRIQEQTNLIMTLLNKHNVEEHIEIKETEVQFNLPIKDNDTLVITENKISQDSKVKEMLIRKLVGVGGDSLRDVIRRIMPRLIDDKILKEYSWVGGKGKQKFSLLNIADVIKDVCKRTDTTKHETEKNIESCVATYLAKSTESFTRREKKKSNDGANDAI